jgi:hypothetical protein
VSSAAEVTRLDRALSVLQGIEGPPPKDAPARPTRCRRGHPRGRRTSGTRSDQFLALVRDRPRITVAEAAPVMGFGPNYL